MNDLMQPDDDPKARIDTRPYQGIAFSYSQFLPVRRLAGFKKSHQVPDEVTIHTQAFVERVGGPHVQADLDRVFSALRKAFRFKRSELQTGNATAGSGFIATPSFRYVSHFIQNSRRAAEAIWQRCVSEITAPDTLLTESFAQVFDGCFDTVDLVPIAPFDLAKLIDHIEDRDDPQLSLEYDRQLTQCDVSISSSNVKMRITENSFQIAHPKPTTTRQLLESLLAAQNTLGELSSR